MRLFPDRSILVLAQEDMLRRRRETMRTVLRFLGVDESFDSGRYSRTLHASTLKRRKTRAGLMLYGTPIGALIRRLPYRLRGPAEIVLFFPLSRQVARPGLNDDVREILIARLRDDVERLRAYTGQRFEEWSV